MVVVGAEGFAGRGEEPETRKARGARTSACIDRRASSAGWPACQPPEELKQQYYAQRDLLGMYRGLREDHLRYLEKWGLIRPVLRTNSDTFFAFADLLVIRQVSAELEGAPFRAIVRSLQAARSGQLAFDFRIDAAPARIIKLQRPKPKEPTEPGGCRLPPPAHARRGIFPEGVGARRRRVAASRGRDLVSEGAGDRSVSGAGADQPRQHSLRQGRAGRGAGALRARHRPRSGFLRGALQPRQHLSRPRPLSGSARPATARRSA